MGSMTRTVLAVAALAAATAAFTAARRSGPETLARAHADSAAVAAVIDNYQSALSKGDSVRALALLSPDAVILESGGIETRAEYRSHHLAGDIAFAKAVASTRGQLKVTVQGSTAWTSGTSTTVGTFNGRAINSTGAESMVLTKGSAGWRIRSIHWSSRNRRPPTP